MNGANAIKDFFMIFFIKIFPDELKQWGQGLTCDILQE
jgi:hypothetical protein